MKNVLVLMHDDAGQESRLQAALDLARAIDGHLTCLDVALLPVVLGDPGMMGESALLIADEQACERANRAATEARLGDEEVPYRWIDAAGDFASTLQDAAGLADVIVLNRALDDPLLPDMLGLAGEVIVKSGKPVLAVPQDVRRFNAFGNVLVAWDGSRQAMAALRAAIPLLRHAARVTILEVDDGSLKLPALEAAEYCSRHEIRPVISRKPSGAGTVADVLLAELADSRADYLVMGGFGHSRLAEALFGGVTRRMLRISPVSLFLAH